jgi:hypothetical protein
MPVTAVYLLFCSSGFVVLYIGLWLALQCSGGDFVLHIVYGLNCALVILFLMLARLYVKLQDQLP